MLLCIEDINNKVVLKQKLYLCTVLNKIVKMATMDSVSIANCNRWKIERGLKTDTSSKKYFRVCIVVKK